MGPLDAAQNVSRQPVPDIPLLVADTDRPDMLPQGTRLQGTRPQGSPLRGNRAETDKAVRGTAVLADTGHHAPSSRTAKPGPTPGRASA